MRGRRGDGRGGRARLAVAVAVLGLATTACRVDVAVDLTVEESGAGVVEVAVHLDEDAAGRLPDLEHQLEVDDLRASGWVVEGPVREGDGRTVVRARREAASLGELDAALDQVTGSEGAFGTLTLEREPTFAHTTYRLVGVIDLVAGVDAFADEALRQHLDGTSLGVEVAELERRAGAPLAEAVRFTVTTTMPDGTTRRWEPRLGQRTPVEMTSTVRNTARLAWTAAALVAGVVAATLLAGGAGRRRRGGSPEAVAPPP